MKTSPTSSIAVTSSTRTLPAPAATAGDRRPVPSVRRRILRGLVAVGVLILVSAAAIAFALSVTPAQSVSTLGQTVEVGATAPTLGTTGPGEVVLFGQTLPTQVDFLGPVRPRLVLTDISVNEQISGAFAPPGRAAAATAVGDALAGGWRRYFAWESAFAALGAVVILGAIAGWRRYGWRRTLVAALGGLLFVEVVNVSAIMVTAFTAPGILRDVGSVSELVGRAQPRPLPPAAGPAELQVQAVVLGDSTAAGLGGPAPARATADDEACGRSSIAFAQTLARVNDWTVTNLGCSGATIEQGVLGSQFVGGRRIPPQLGEARRAVDAQVVIVSIGANDMQWGTLVRLCGASDTCDDRALTAFFQRNLDAFTQNYFELLRQLAQLPGDPQVLINGYYVPFDPNTLDCLSSSGLSPAKIGVLLDRLDALNRVLANGARTFGYQSVEPDFSGHELCTDQSYVQGPDEEAPLHPNARGQLVIALADERALLDAG